MVGGGGGRGGELAARVGASWLQPGMHVSWQQREQRRAPCPPNLRPPPHTRAPAQTVRVYGFARSKMSDEEFRDLIAGSLTCRLSDA